MDVVVPLCVETQSAGGPCRDDPRVVEVALGDEREGASQMSRQPVDLDRQFLEQMCRRVVDQGMHGVEPQGVDVEVAEPAQRVVDDVAADLGGLGTRQVDVAPPGVGAVGEVRAESVEVVARRSEVVVDDVQSHREPAPVTLVDEPLQPVRAAVLFVDGVPEHAVVAPVVGAAPGRNRHQLDEADAEVDEVVEAADRGVPPA